MSDLVMRQTRGGQYYGQFTSGNVETQIYTGVGLLNRIITITAGTAVLSIYDGTNSTAGTLIYTSITNDVTGTTKDLEIPVSTGIVIKGTTGTQGAIVTYCKTGANGV